MRFPREQEQELVGNGFTGANAVYSLPSVAEGDDESGAHVPLLVGGESYEFAAMANLDLFFTRVYRYWNEHGLRSILLSGLLNLLALAFTAAFSTFLLLFVDWRALHAECLAPKAGGSGAADPAASGADGGGGGGGGGGCDLAAVALDRRPLLGRGVGADLLAVSYIAVCMTYLGWTAAHYLMDARDMREVAHFMANKLGISDSKVMAMTWPEVVHRLVLVQRTTRLCIARDLDELAIVARIMRKDNYLIAMINRDVLQLHLQPPPDAPRPLRTTMGVALRLLGGGGGGAGCGGGRGCPPMLTKTLEWNLRWCILDHMFDDEFRIRPEFSDVAALRRRLRLVAAANLLLSPFLLMFLLAYFFMRNAERLYHHPAALGSRRWSGLARWRIRELNELPHYLHHRLNAGHPAALRYVAQFPSYNLASIARFMVFLTGSFVALLLFMTFLDESLLERPLLGRQVVWWLGTMTLVLATCRTLVSEEPVAYDPERALADVVSYTHYMPRHWRGRAHTAEVQSAFLSLFRLKVALFAEELFSLVTTPLLLACSLPACAESIVEFVSTFTVHIDGVGDVCSMATFDLARHGNTKYGSPVHAEKALRSRQGKLEKSILTFKETYATWEPGELGRRLLEALQANVAGAGGTDGGTVGDAAVMEATGTAALATAGPPLAAAGDPGDDGFVVTQAATRRLFERLSYQQGVPSMFPYQAAAGVDKVGEAAPGVSAGALARTASATQLRARSKLSAEAGERRQAPATSPGVSQASAAPSAAVRQPPAFLHPGIPGGRRQQPVPLHMLPYHGVKSYMSNASQVSAGGGAGWAWRPPQSAAGGGAAAAAAVGPAGGSPAPSVASSQFSNLAAPHMHYYPVPLYYAHQQQARHAQQQQRRMYEQMLYGAMACGISPMVATGLTPHPPPSCGRRMAASSAAASWHGNHAVPHPYDVFGPPYLGVRHPHPYAFQPPPGAAPLSPGPAAPRPAESQPQSQPPTTVAAAGQSTAPTARSNTLAGPSGDVCGGTTGAGGVHPHGELPCSQSMRSSSQPSGGSTTNAAETPRPVHVGWAATATGPCGSVRAAAPRAEKTAAAHASTASCLRTVELDSASTAEGNVGGGVSSTGSARVMPAAAAGSGSLGDGGGGAAGSPERSIGAASGVGTGSATAAPGYGSDILDMRGVEDMAEPPPPPPLPFEDVIGTAAAAGGGGDVGEDDPIGLDGFVSLTQRRHPSATTAVVAAAPGGTADDDDDGDLDGFGLVAPAAVSSSAMAFGSGSGSGTGSGSGIVLRRWCPTGSASASSVSASAAAAPAAVAAAAFAAGTSAGAKSAAAVAADAATSPFAAAVRRPLESELLGSPTGPHLQPQRQPLQDRQPAAPAPAHQAASQPKPQAEPCLSQAPTQSEEHPALQQPLWSAGVDAPGASDPSASSSSQLYYSADYYAASPYYGLEEYAMYDYEGPTMYGMGVGGDVCPGPGLPGVPLAAFGPVAGSGPMDAWASALTGAPSMLGFRTQEDEAWVDASGSLHQHQQLHPGRPEQPQWPPQQQQRQQPQRQQVCGEAQGEARPGSWSGWQVEGGAVAGGGSGHSFRAGCSAAATPWTGVEVAAAAVTAPSNAHAAASTGTAAAAGTDSGSRGGGSGGSPSSFATDEASQLHSRLAHGHALLQSLYESNDHTVQHRLQQQLHVRSLYSGGSLASAGAGGTSQEGGSSGGGGDAVQSSRGFGWPRPGVQE